MSLNELVAQADELTLYLETENEGVDYDVDNVVMEKVVISDAWRKQAEEDSKQAQPEIDKPAAAEKSAEELKAEEEAAKKKADEDP